MSSLSGDERLQRVLNSLPYKCRRSGRFYVTRCPSHTDKQASLNIRLDNKDIVRVVCRTGCDRNNVLAALGLDWRDLYPSNESKRAAGWDLVAHYDYPDVNLRRVKFIKPDGEKVFSWWSKLPKGNYRCALSAAWYELWDDGSYHTVKITDGDGGKLTCDDPAIKPHNDAVWFDEITARSLYHVERLESLEPGALVLMPEGEKDCESSAAIGFVATTEGGASDWRTDHAAALRGLVVVVLPDNDDAGERRLARIAPDLKETAEAVLVLRLPGLPKKGDLTDWRDARKAEGMGAEQIRVELQKLIDTEAVEWEPQAAADEVTERAKAEAQGAVERACVDAVPDDYDPPICADGAREKQLRRLPRDAGRLIDMMTMILGALGFEKTHHRILGAMLAYVHGLKTSPLVYFSVSNLKLYSKYIKKRQSLADVRDDSKAKMVGRDVRELRDEQDACGVTVLDYIPGKVSFSDEGVSPAYPPKYRIRLLRFALIALHLSDTIRRQNDLKQWEADEIAARLVSEMLPRREKIARVKTDASTASAKADGKASPPVTEPGVLKAFESLIAQITDRHIARCSGAEALSQEIDDITSQINRIAAAGLARGITEMAGEQESGTQNDIVDKNVHKVSRLEGVALCQDCLRMQAADPTNEGQCVCGGETCDCDGCLDALELLMEGCLDSAKLGLRCEIANWTAEGGATSKPGSGPLGNVHICSSKQECKDTFNNLSDVLPADEFSLPFADQSNVPAVSSASGLLGRERTPVERYATECRLWREYLDEQWGRHEHGREVEPLRGAGMRGVLAPDDAPNGELKVEYQRLIEAVGLVIESHLSDDNPAFDALLDAQCDAGEEAQMALDETEQQAEVFKW